MVLRRGFCPASLGSGLAAFVCGRSRRENTLIHGATGDCNPNPSQAAGKAHHPNHALKALCLIAIEAESLLPESCEPPLIRESVMNFADTRGGIQSIAGCLVRVKHLAILCGRKDLMLNGIIMVHVNHLAWRDLRGFVHDSGHGRRAHRSVTGGMVASIPD